jgi:hypothetical protein
MLPSRRRFLQCTVGAASVLAGCAADDRSPTPTAGAPATVDFETVFVRSRSSEPFVVLDDETTSASASGDVPFTREPLLTAADADRVSFTRSVDGDDDARAFLDDTDFDRSAVYLAEQRVSACRRLEVSYVTTDGDSFDIEFCSPLRPADVECRVEDTHVVAAFVRFPFGADQLAGYGVGGGTSCHRPRPREGSE